MLEDFLRHLAITSLYFVQQIDIFQFIYCDCVSLHSKTFLK